MPEKEHLKKFRWQPGQSGNPLGRPKASVREAIKNLAAEAFKDRPIAEGIAIMALRLAISGDLDAIKFITDQLDGRLPQPVEQKHEGQIIVKVLRGDRS